MISIVVPCYNCENTFKRCLDSIRNQTQKKIEIILVDDGSLDSTYQLCEDAAREDSRIRALHQENKGLMNAWKMGVKEASGEYVTFCDSDDYLDIDLVEILEKKIENYQADIIVYGMKMQYEDNSTSCRDNRLEEGYYTKADIEKLVLPRFFSNGNMESCMLLASRCSKLFRRELLLSNFGYLSDAISNGEDALTTFASVLSADSIYCMKNYFPYHYMRNNASMIGKYDELMFEKYVMLREQLHIIANIYDYPYQEQIERNFLSNTLLCMKKEICRNKGAGCRKVCNRLRLMRENEIFIGAIQVCEINQFDLKSRVFAHLIINRRYFITYILTRLMDLLGIGRA